MHPFRGSLPDACLAALSLILFCSCSWSGDPFAREPVRVVADMEVGETRTVELHGGKTAVVRLISVDNERDRFRAAVRSASVRVEVNGREMVLPSGNYNLPVAGGGVRIDCPVTRDYYTNTTRDAWGLGGAARLRLWPAFGALIDTRRFLYPLRQSWFASQTQMGNEPVYVNGAEDLDDREIYYHSGLDFGGVEGRTEVLSATDGLVIISGEGVMNGWSDYPFEPGYESVYVLGEYGWVYRYSHLREISPGVIPGARVRRGRQIGLLGKEGNSGGWSHLHFEILSRQPSGRWGAEDGYAYVREAYLRQYNPEVVAVARPHILAAVGQKVNLDGSKSWSATGDSLDYEWLLSDGTRAFGPVQTMVYGRPGTYSEVLKVEDFPGRPAYDFCVVDVLDPSAPGSLPPSIHAAFHPSLGIRPGQPVLFSVRSFNAPPGAETVDFGDGTPAVSVRSHPGYLWSNRRYRNTGLDFNSIYLDPAGYAFTEHAYDLPGDYLVRVERTGEHGWRAVTHLWVRVGESL
jgi:murein DD-endopeptidase MepM/ murein hydrolase activator NlpD